MDIKNFVRRGLLDEGRGYKNVMRFTGRPPANILALLEGKARRKVHLSGNRYLYENYFAPSFVGVEDLLLEHSHSGAVGVYPGSHYVVWNAEDFLNAVQINPLLARRVILELSRRIRIYDLRHRTTDLELRQDPGVEDVGAPEAEMTDALYEMSFADEDEFPPHIVSRLARLFEPGSYLLRQDDTTDELYIIIEGQTDVYQTPEDGRRHLIDSLGAGDMVGEMAQFDGLPRSADVIARNTVKALEFKREDFHLLFQLHPKWSHKLMYTLSQRIEQRLSNLENLDLKK